MWQFVLAVVGLLFHWCDSEAAVTCRNENNEEVDWYIIYKLPQQSGDGLKYLYMDEKSNGWTVGNKLINSDSGILANTLKPLFDYVIKKTEGFGYILYSDQPPTTIVSPSFGHSKGIVMLDKNTTGVWLSHSTPKFPRVQPNKKEFWSDSGTLNAQTFICMTYSYAEFKKIGSQLKYIHPHPYDYHIPPGFHQELQCVIERGCYPKSEPYHQGQTLTSRNNIKFLSVAKYTRYGDDLYSGLLVNSLKRTLYVKSWGSMQQPLPCINTSAQIWVKNVKDVKLLPGSQSFPDTVDHSKWCVTDIDQNNACIACIADLNRERSQMRRGGGAICINNSRVCQAFSGTFDKNTLCPNKRERKCPCTEPNNKKKRRRGS